VIQLLHRDGNEEFYHCETCTRILYYATPAASPASASAGGSSSDPSVAPTAAD
jgi:hypothetical protein